MGQVECNFKRFTYVAQNLKCFATIVNMPTILMCISRMKVWSAQAQLIIPVITPTAERSFSALKRTKTYLSNSMTQQGLNHCMIVHIYRNKIDNLDLAEIAQEFIERNDWRKRFFGHFKPDSSLIM